LPSSSELYGERFQTWLLAGPSPNASVSGAALRTAWAWVRDRLRPNSGIVLFERPDSLIERLIGSKNGGSLRSS